MSDSRKAKDKEMDAWLGVKLQKWRLSRYKKARTARTKKEPDLSFSVWVRRALDRQADEDLQETAR